MASFLRSLLCPCLADDSSPQQEQQHQPPVQQQQIPLSAPSHQQQQLQNMPRSYVNAAYYPTWLVYKDKPPSYLDVENITHVFYAFVGVNEDGTLRWLDDWADLNKETDGEKGCLAALAKLKRNNPHLHTIVSIGGGASSKEFAVLAASSDARQTFANQARKFCDSYELDGIDIDWEHPKNADEGRDYVKLLQAARDALPEEDYFLTTALPVGQYVLKHIDLAAVARLVNYLNLMAYDFTGSWTEVSGNHSQLHPLHSDFRPAHPQLRTCGCDGVDYLLSRGFPSRKILLGIPSYARYFPNAHAPGHSFEDPGEMDYCDMPDEWIENAGVDDTAVAAFYVDTTGGKGYVSFDVPRTVWIKASYAAQKCLGGLFYWTGTGDKRAGLSLIATGMRTLRSS